jgi:hypothetical protein
MFVWRSICLLKWLLPFNAVVKVNSVAPWSGVDTNWRRILRSQIFFHRRFSGEPTQIMCRKFVEYLGTDCFHFCQIRVELSVVSASNTKRRPMKPSSNVQCTDNFIAGVLVVYWKLIARSVAKIACGEGLSLSSYMTSCPFGCIITSSYLSWTLDSHILWEVIHHKIDTLLMRLFVIFGHLLFCLVRQGLNMTWMRRYQLFVNKSLFSI